MPITKERMKDISDAASDLLDRVEKTKKANSDLSSKVKSYSSFYQEYSQTNDDKITQQFREMLIDLISLQNEIEHNLGGFPSQYLAPIIREKVKINMNFKKNEYARIYQKIRREKNMIEDNSELIDQYQAMIKKYDKEVGGNSQVISHPSDPYIGREPDKSDSIIDPHSRSHQQALSLVPKHILGQVKEISRRRFDELTRQKQEQEERQQQEQQEDQQEEQEEKIQERQEQSQPQFTQLTPEQRQAYIEEETRKADEYLQQEENDVADPNNPNVQRKWPNSLTSEI